MALGGVFAALSMVMLYIGGLTVLDLSVLVVCSFITIFVTVETGAKMGWLFAAVTSALAFILLPSKLYAAEYALFAALYPMIRPVIDRLPKKLAFVVKVVTLDVMLLGVVLLGKFIFTSGDDGFPLGWLTFLLGSAFFAVYEIALTLCVGYYINKLRKKLNISKFL